MECLSPLQGDAKCREASVQVFSANFVHFGLLVSLWALVFNRFIHLRFSTYIMTSMVFPFRRQSQVKIPFQSTVPVVVRLLQIRAHVSDDKTI